MAITRSVNASSCSDPAPGGPQPVTTTALTEPALLLRQPGINQAEVAEYLAEQLEIADACVPQLGVDIVRESGL
ncbi:hypothetical protein [Micromonospora sp. NPDC050495]|uniref:hypothetical protein n=1 Tax=Micromonospora sp. NPDC050495 TaxID=3154936 RepID=UPI0033CD5DCD